MNQEERVIHYHLESIRNNAYNKNESIKFLTIKVGQYRVEAEKHHGYVKSLIHKMANDLEKQLVNAIKESIQQTIRA